MKIPEQIRRNANCKSQHDQQLYCWQRYRTKYIISLVKLTSKINKHLFCLVFIYKPKVRDHSTRSSAANCSDISPTLLERVNCCINNILHIHSWKSMVICIVKLFGPETVSCVVPAFIETVSEFWSPSLTDCERLLKKSSDQIVTWSGKF